MDNTAMRKLIEMYRAKERHQKEFQNKENYQSRFGIKDGELNNFNIKGIATDRKENKLVLVDDKQDQQKLLLYANKYNNLYYLNSGRNYSEAVHNTFGESTNYEVVDDNLFIYNSKKQSLTNYEQLSNYHNREKQLTYDQPLAEDRKYRLTDKTEVINHAKEDLAISLGLTATAFKGDINISDIEQVTDKESMVTIENEITGKSEHLISNFKDSFVDKVKDNLNVSPSVRLGFEEFKNASMQIAMGFTEFYGARYDESTLERDPKVVLTEKGYSLSTFDKEGNKTDIASADTFEEAVKLSKELKKEEFQSLDSHDLEHELQRNKG
ncbi:TPA: transfer complex protein TraA [Staphylococcus aureus]|uniref:conjugative transfer protein TrsA n=1 Tax=Staphylococcus TaxID=1279 RepID=UPI0009836526|nr:conjugative transfer protein TrsA [Staphylococcus aureus]AQR26689.1 transfer complex protein TraA [Staphylococcus aureus]AQR53208.1 transfer complex protein TraA [Staphylococcus aureus]MBO8865159.1 transfer complex protein TraA [Staphylococcus aureus]HAR4273680.1 transfer complex protein TraA [Staphylococcus aureus]HCW7256841.1 transfer complex protein TraA [Staphylococcus aureus]